jgi:hypothetical protein
MHEAVRGRPGMASRSALVLESTTSVKAITLVLEERIEVPTDLRWWPDLRGRATSEAFPRRGCILTVIAPAMCRLLKCTDEI